MCIRTKTCVSSSAIAAVWLVSLLCLLACPLASEAQEPVRVPRKVPRQDVSRKLSKQPAVRDSVPWHTGTFVGIDLYGAGHHLLGSDYVGTELSLSTTLKHRFLPTIELGLGRTDAVNDLGQAYRSQPSPYLRVGVDYNTLYKKKSKENVLYVGLRYGLASFGYDLRSLPTENGNVPSLEDGYWSENRAFHYEGLKGRMQWLELVFGVRAQVYKRLYMGWSLRMKYRTAASVSAYGNPHFVPGYGKFGHSAMGITYSLIYKLPL